MRFFQPLKQLGYARILAETRTHFPLSPGLLAIEKIDLTDGYAGSFDIPFPPRFEDIDDHDYSLHWLLPENKREKYNTTKFQLTEQPFYPPFAEEIFIDSDFDEYVDRFLLKAEPEEEIFTLPISQINNPRIKEIADTESSLYILTGLASLLSNQRRLTETLVHLREILSPDIALYLPGPIAPSLYSFLIYMGIDFFDNSMAYYVSNKGYFLTEDQVYKQSNHPKCYCVHCTNDEPSLFKHNESVIKNTLSRIRDSIERETFRAQVERDVHNNVTFAAALRRVDTHFNRNLRIRTPMVSSAPVKCIGEESFTRPLITEFRERIRERYRPDPSSNLVILLPCSARKPYSFSRSHLFYHKAMRKAGKGVFKSLTELIVTSPLSVVPRELEDIYPAKYYDIPVAGEWSEKEITVTAELLVDVLNHFPKDTVIVNHMHGRGYGDIVERIKEKLPFDIRNTSDDSRPTSDESLKKLADTLYNIQQTRNTEESKGISSKIRKMQAVADFEYGAGTGEILFPLSVRIKGKYPRDQQIFKEKEHIATFITKSGYLALFPRYANLILDKAHNTLEFGAERVSGSNIYAPGVIKASDQIHPNDEIFIVNDNQVIATATALVSGEDMNKMTSGIVAEVKKKVRTRK
ncbi:MAG: DUF5591 domain-containing protein [Candidatus Heimdallarchaeota archaeon]|nr:DUF5591 domain-containing protein [Candidatus Heimdallarchaeota archaeon]